MSVTYSTVACCEMKDSVTETFDKDGLKATVQLMVPWANRYALRADLIGFKRLWPYGYGARVISVGLAPFGAKGISDGQGLTYESAIATVNYSSKENEDLVSESLEPSVEFVTQDHKHYRWTNASGDPLVAAEAPGRQIFSFVLTRTLHKLEPPLPPGLLTCLGQCNETVYTSALLGLAFAEETLLFQPTSISRTITSDGSDALDVNLKFAFKPDGWNKYYRAATGAYEEIFNVETSAVEKSYPPGDFSWALY
jgi:hypothetical protein